MANIDPTSVTVVAGAAGSGQATVSWTQPVSGAPGQYFVRTVNPANGMSAVAGVFPGSAVSQLISGLIPGQTLQFIIQTNLGGNSAASASLLVPLATPVAAIGSTIQLNTLRKMKANMLAAFNNNATDLPPLNPPYGGAWTTAVSYSSSMAVTNGGNVYINTTYLASTAAGATGPTGTGPNTVSDGAITWQYVGPNQTSVAGSGVWSFTTAAITANLGANAYMVDAAANPGKFLVSGGIPFTNVFTSVMNVTGPPSIVANGNFGWPESGKSLFLTAVEASISFETDAPKIQISNNTTGLGNISNTVPIGGLRIDSQFFSQGCYGTIANNANSAYLLDFSATKTPRKRRRFTLCSPANNFYSSIGVDYQSKIWYPTRSNPYRIVIEGDSESGGAATSNFNTYWISPGTSWGMRLGDLIGCDDVCNTAIGGTGFVQPGPQQPYLGRLSNIVALNPDVVIVAGNHNDASFTSAAQTAAYKLYLQSLRAAVPNAVIFVFGMMPEQNSANGANQTSDQLLHNVVTALGDPMTFWYSIMADSTTLDAVTGGVSNSWFTGTGSTSAPANNGNCDLAVSPNGHPSQAGSDMMAYRYAAAIRAMVNSVQV